MLNTTSEDGMLEAIGWRFREIRLEANVTQQELAKLSGVSRSTIARFEQGENITLKQLIALLQHTERQDLLSKWISTEPPTDSRVRERVRKKKEESLAVEFYEDITQKKSNPDQGRLTKRQALIKALDVIDFSAALRANPKQTVFDREGIDWLELKWDDYWK